MTYVEVKNFSEDFVYGNPSVEARRLRHAAIKEAQAIAGVEWPSGVVFDTSQQAISLVGAAVTDPTRKNADTIKLVQAFGEVTNIRPPQEILDAWSGLDKSFVWDFADQQISEWASIGSEMMNESMAASAVANSPVAGDAFNLGMEVYGAFKDDGFLSDSEIRSVSASAGALVGGVVGSIFPGVGTAIGAMVGSVIGSAVGEVITLYTEPNWESIMDDLRREAEALRAKLKVTCGSAQTEFNEKYILPELLRLAHVWHSTEASLGFRFGLRWWDANPGLPFEYAAFATQQENRMPLHYLQQGSRTFSPPLSDLANKGGKGYVFDQGRFECRTDYKSRQGKVDYGGKEWTVTGAERIGTCNFFCPSKVLGCNYPSNTGSLFGTQRLIEAYNARGFAIPANFGCDTIENVVNQVGRCSSSSVAKAAGIKDDDDSETKEAKCRAYMKRMMVQQAEGLKMDMKFQQQRFFASTNFIAQDLTRTASLMKAQNDIFANRIALSQPILFKTTSTEFAAMRLSHVQRMRTMALLGGAGVLGLGLWRAMR